MESWYTDDSIQQKALSSSIGISDEVILEHSFYDTGPAIWDDCDNTSNSTRKNVTYSFSNYPFQINTEFIKQGEENGFSMAVYVNRFSTNEYSASYNFSRISNNGIEILENSLINDTVYDEAIQVTFSNSAENTQIQQLYIVKETGIIRIELNNGAILILN